MSRHDMLEWVNCSVQAKHGKIEELCSGVAYCQMMELIFPRCIGVKRIKLNAKLEHECLHNLKLLQLAFTRLKIDKVVPIERLLKGRFQDNFEFLQWFRKFYETHATGKENLKVQVPAKNPENSISTAESKSTAGADASAGAGADTINISPPNFATLQNSRAEIRDQMRVAEKDRDFYYQKLRSIEDLLNRTIDKKEAVEFCKRILSFLYKNDNVDAVAAQEGEEAPTNVNEDF